MVLRKARFLSRTFFQAPNPVFRDAPIRRIEIWLLLTMGCFTLRRLMVWKKAANSGEATELKQELFWLKISMRDLNLPKRNG